MTPVDCEPRRRVHITLGTDADERHAVIEIADNGPGIPEMEIEALAFDTTQGEHGSGVGRALIQWWTESLGGELTVDTTDGEGGTLTIRLPRVDPPDRPP